jgi:hypothetical protein
MSCVECAANDVVDAAAEALLGVSIDEFLGDDGEVRENPLIITSATANAQLWLKMLDVMTLAEERSS